MNNWKKGLRIVFMVLICLGFWGTSVLGATLNDDQTITLRIIHTNDMHARYTYNEKYHTIGYAKLKTMINRDDPDLVVDGGDSFHGQSSATIENGGSIAQLMAAVGYDAMASGNHDFNYGSTRLLELGMIAQTKILGANVRYSDSGEAFFDDFYLIKEINVGGERIKIGVFGLINPDIYSETAPANVEGLTFGNRESTIEVAKQSVADLKEKGCDIIVAITHIGDSNNGTLMRSDAIALGAPGIDLIVDGHTHDIENYEVNDTLIVQTGHYSSAVGEVAITIKQNDQDSNQAMDGKNDEMELLDDEENKALEITEKEATYTVIQKIETLTPVSQATDELIPADETVAALISEIEAREDPIKKQIVGNTPVKLGGNTDNIWEDARLAELNLGRVLSDSYRFITGADIGIENAGGIRAQIEAGEINKGQVIDVLPFGNYLVTKKISGSDILKIMERSIQIGVRNQVAKDNQDSWPDNCGSYLQWSGITAQYDLSKPKGKRIFSAKIGNEKLNDVKYYTIVCSSYLETSDDYPELKAAEVLNEYGACDESLISYLKNAENQRFITAINIPNITVGIEPEMIPEIDPKIDLELVPEQEKIQKQSQNNPKTGYSLRNGVTIFR